MLAMSTDHSTRCAWIRQNDADGDALGFMCGAAAAQMILYGRDNSKFQSGSATKLKHGVAQLRADQALVWQAVIDESQRCRLPSGAHYNGVPESDQICESATCWAAFPDALAATLSHGFSVADGRVAGVSAKVRAVDDEVILERAIIDSLDRGVAAAVLIHGMHWIVVYRYTVLAGGEVKIYYRDGFLSKVESDPPWSEGGFELAVDQLTKGVYGRRFVAVTASSRVPIITHAIGPAPPGLFRRITADHGSSTDGPRPFPDSLGVDLATRNANNLEWERAFAGARLRFALKVTGLESTGDYYLVDYTMPDDGAGRTGSLRTGTILVDAYTLRPRMTTGVEDRGESLPAIFGPNELGPILDRLDGYAISLATESVTLDRSRLRLDGDLVWTPCDQSSSPFLPFYRVRQLDADRNVQATVYIRIDGRVFRELTYRRAGI
jgi:hypothetical protein